MVGLAPHMGGNLRFRRSHLEVHGRKSTPPPPWALGGGPYLLRRYYSTTPTDTGPRAHAWGARSGAGSKGRDQGGARCSVPGDSTPHPARPPGASGPRHYPRGSPRYSFRTRLLLFLRARGLFGFCEGLRGDSSYNKLLSSCPGFDLGCGPRSTKPPAPRVGAEPPNNRGAGA